MAVVAGLRRDAAGGNCGCVLVFAGIIAAAELRGWLWCFGGCGVALGGAVELLQLVAGWRLVLRGVARFDVAVVKQGKAGERCCYWCCWML